MMFADCPNCLGTGWIQDCPCEECAMGGELIECWECMGNRVIPFEPVDNDEYWLEAVITPVL